MPAALVLPLAFDLLRVGFCRHPECMALRGAGLGPTEFPSLVGLFAHPRHGYMLYDTGYSRHFHASTRRFPECLYRAVTPVTLPPEEELLAQLDSRGLAPADIAVIVLSHFHADHVAGVRDFPSARFLATRAERRANEARGRLGRLRRAYLRDLLPEDFESRVTYAEDRPALALPVGWASFPAGYDLLGDGSLIGLNLPGHTESQLGLAFRAAEGGPTLLVGDACWKIEGLEQNRRPARAAYPLFADRKAYDDSFTRLVHLHGAAEAPRIIPSHCRTSWQRFGGTRTVFRG